VTGALLDAPRRRLAEAACEARAGGGRVTLEERLQATWRGLRASGAAQCPVCHGGMTLEAGSEADTDAGRCRDCGASLS